MNPAEAQENIVSPTHFAERFRLVIAAVSTGRLDELDAHIRYDVIDHNPILSQGDGLPGLKYWAQAMHRVFPDLSATVADTVTEGGKVAARVRWAGTHSASHLGVEATHRYAEFESFYIVHFDDDLITEWWDGSDTMRELRQAGATVTLPERR